MRTTAILVLSAAALAACGKQEAAKQAPASVPAAANVQIDGPAAGKWRITASMNGQAMPPIETCFKKQMTWEEAQAIQRDAGITCSENSYRRDLSGKIIGHSVCQMGEMKVTTDTIVTGNMNTAYTTETTSTMDPPPAPDMATSKMAAKAERIGDCAPEDLK